MCTFLTKNIQIPRQPSTSPSGNVMGFQHVVLNPSDQQHLCIALLLCIRTEQMQRQRGGKEKASASVARMCVLMNLLWLYHVLALSGV